MDRGIPTEKVLAQMRSAQPPVLYLVGTPRGRLSRYEKRLTEVPWQLAREGVSVKLLAEGQELYVLAQSQDRVNKERAMRRRQLKGLWKRLKQLQQQKLKRDVLLKKLGAALHRYPVAGRLVQSAVSPDTARLSFSLHQDKLRAWRKREGRYLLRSNITSDRSAEELWQFYVQLTEVEAAFQNLKDDLSLRPIYHQLDHRIEAHRSKAITRLAFPATLFLLFARRAYAAQFFFDASGFSRNLSPMFDEKPLANLASHGSEAELAVAWFCLRSQPKHEHIAAEHLRRMEGVEVFNPRIRFKRSTRTGPAQVTEAMFPNYLFARFDWKTSLTRVHYAPGVSGVVHFGSKWPTVPDGAIEEIRALVGDSGVHVALHEITPGDPVTVSGTVFHGLQAIVTQVMPGKERVMLLLEFLGRQTAVEVGLNAIIKHSLRC